MSNPFTYRPTDPDDIDWEDNWLSNAMAWASDRLMPKVCKQEGHWTGKVTNYLWTDCPCCLSIRWLIVGIVIGAGLAFALGNAL
jgi:hypothetical protein